MCSLVPDDVFHSDFGPFDLSTGDEFNNFSSRLLC